jgi:hypothetical protein
VKLLTNRLIVLDSKKLKDNAKLLKQKKKEKGFKDSASFVPDIT